jgi:hypothetical protein
MADAGRVGDPCITGSQDRDCGIGGQDSSNDAAGDCGSGCQDCPAGDCGIGGHARTCGVRRFFGCDGSDDGDGVSQGDSSGS